MLAVLKNRTYRHLFLAQLVALLGTGLATIALGLLAYDLAGQSAGLVLGTILTIKMLAYVLIAPIAAAFAEKLPRRAMLVGLDLIRAAVAMCLPFVDAVWQVYVLIFLLQSASAGFSPTFQATIPDVLRDEKEYTNALSLSRLAYDVESLLSPALAALLLGFVTFSALFWGTALGFLVSAALVVMVILPSPKPATPRGIWDRTTRGIRLYLATPRLRGMIGLNVVVASLSAMVLVNTVVLVKGPLGLGESQVALALGAFGAGSMVTAILLPRALEKLRDRQVMFTGAALGIGTFALWALWSLMFGYGYTPLLLGWFATGLAYAAIQTPVGRLLRRSAAPEDRPALFAAQFTLSHLCWLFTYPLAGALMTWGGGIMAGMVLGGTATCGLIVAKKLWPAATEKAAPSV